MNTNRTINIARLFHTRQGGDSNQTKCSIDNQTTITIQFMIITHRITIRINLFNTTQDLPIAGHRCLSLRDLLSISTHMLVSLFRALVQIMAMVQQVALILMPIEQQEAPKVGILSKTRV